MCEDTCVAGLGPYTKLFMVVMAGVEVTVLEKVSCFLWSTTIGNPAFLHSNTREQRDLSSTWVQLENNISEVKSSFAFHYYICGIGVIVTDTYSYVCLTRAFCLCTCLANTH